MTVWPLENVLEAFEKRSTLKNIFKILIRRIFNLIWRDVLNDFDSNEPHVAPWSLKIQGYSLFEIVFGHM